MVKINIEITSSKVTAIIILALAFILDLLNDKAGTVLMFAIPFVAGLVVNKQYNDRKKIECNGDNS